MPLNRRTARRTPQTGVFAAHPPPSPRPSMGPPGLPLAIDPALLGVGQPYRAPSEAPSVATDVSWATSVYSAAHGTPIPSRDSATPFPPSPSPGASARDSETPFYPPPSPGATARARNPTPSLRQRATRINLTEEQETVLVRICVENRLAYDQGSKKDFWDLVRAQFRAASGIDFRNTGQKLSMLVKRRLEELESQTTGTEHAVTERTNALDSWLEVLKEQQELALASKEEKNRRAAEAGAADAERDNLLRRRADRSRFADNFTSEGTQDLDDELYDVVESRSTTPSTAGRKRRRIDHDDRDDRWYSLMDTLIDTVSKIGGQGGGGGQETGTIDDFKEEIRGEIRTLNQQVSLQMSTLLDAIQAQRPHRAESSERSADRSLDDDRDRGREGEAEASPGPAVR